MQQRLEFQGLNRYLDDLFDKCLEVLNAGRVSGDIAFVAHYLDKVDEGAHVLSGGEQEVKEGLNLVFLDQAPEDVPAVHIKQALHLLFIEARQVGTFIYPSVRPETALDWLGGPLLVGVTAIVVLIVEVVD